MSRSSAHDLPVYNPELSFMEMAIADLKQAVTKPASARAK
jgi:hypothetical protein